MKDQNGVEYERVYYYCAEKCKSDMCDVTAANTMPADIAQKYTVMLLYTVEGFND